ncbi:3-oxo-isoapionate-4-phosphate decarboxylase OiaX [Lichenicoccus roseus]|uniref:Ribulose 1,5-bisphosphate carboxylase n=1 Tax=Lichenicoccus roseus TaxID=2683649 RepID=A0A5R9J9B1_9PROT|nr:3-oxo-isoapionate-4-phosphate decarboxylase OiaX [Lichenicoccus roseus]TLU74204.1 ribulose 1,5-bisphosphate carboxylase [Lichenicoccus roseus]
MRDDASITVTYRIETAGDPLALASKIASDQSTGTFVDLPGETADLKVRCAARVAAVRALPDAGAPSFPQPDGVAGPYRRADVDIEFPLDVVGTDIAALVTIALGGVFSVKGLTGIRIVGLRLPPAFIRAHPGPQFGIEGTRTVSGVHGRPLIGTIIKPNLGLSPEEGAAITRQLVEAGVDFIKDDEKLMSPAYSPLEARVRAVMPVLRDHEQRTGRRVMYAFGISSADPERMLRHHDLVADAGGTAAVININSVGYGGLAFLRRRSRLVLHAHRAGWDILTRHPGLGMDFSVYQTLWRLLGIDQFQINGIGAKYWEPDDSFVQSFRDCSTPLLSTSDRALPVVCSGQWGGQAPETYARTGRTVDLMYLGGGGIIAHPGGPGAGVRAIRQAWEATVADIPLATYARDHRELAESLRKFGGMAI